MERKPKKSTRKLVIHAISKPFQNTGASHQPRVSVNNPAIPPSPSHVIEELNQQREAITSTQSQAAHTILVVPSTTAPVLTTAHSPLIHQPMDTFSSTARLAKNIAKGTLGLLSSVAEGIPIPGVKGVFYAIGRMIEVIEITQSNQEEFRTLEMRCKTLMDTIISLQTLLEIPHALQSNLIKLERDLGKTLRNVEQQLASGTMTSLINSQDNLDILQRINKDISYFLQFYSATLFTHVHQTMLGDREKQTIERLPKVRAGYDDHISGIPDRAPCFTGTRQQLLSDIKAWINDPSRDKPIYVLNGIAGIGKTTVAQTIAEYAAASKLLGGSFFFSRAEDERKSGDYFFATLAFQLAQHDADIGAHIAAALRDAPDILDKTLETQMEVLIVNPIQNAKTVKQIILVVDAFDECLESDARILLHVLARNIYSMPNINIFMTARPESHIEAVLNFKGQFQPFFMHEIDKAIAKEDIGLFLQYALSKEQVKLLCQSGDWEPASEDLRLLVEKCGVLFIMASTAVKYILDEDVNDPGEQLNQLLKGLDIEEGEYGVLSSLDKMYLEILKSSIPNRDSLRSVFLKNFQKVVGAMVVLEDSLSLLGLANLSEMGESDIKITLRKLHSIMAPVSNTQVPQLYHKSFPDFLTDRKRCMDNQFYIDPEIQHAQVAQLCLNIMNENLHANMCNLQGMNKYLSNSKIVEKDLNKQIPDHLKYACVYWAIHFSKAGESKLDHLWKLLLKFTFTHLLHWMEVLSLVGKLEVAHSALKLAKKMVIDSGFGWMYRTWPGSSNWVQRNESKVDELSELLDDGSQIVAKFYEVIRTSASHIYYSGLPFLPLKSQMYRKYSPVMLDLPDVFGGQQDHWEPLLATLEGHLNMVIVLVFSPDGSRLASGSSDTSIRVWDGNTGAFMMSLEGHLGWARTLAFSPDGSRLISGSSDMTIRCWNLVTGRCVTTLEGHLGSVNAVAYSPDGSRLASGSDDGTIKLWDGTAGDCITTLKGHLDGVTSIAFSPDGIRLASGSDDNTVKLWDGVTGSCVATLEGHTEWILNIAFSPDSSRLASSSDDNTIRLWNGVTGDHIVTLEGHRSAVMAVSFSINGSRLASGSSDTTIKLWDGVTGAYIATLEGHSSWVTTVIFSPDGSRLASGSDDKTIKLWDSSTGVYHATLEGHSSEVTTIAFSPDGSRLASGSHDSTIKLWDGAMETYFTALKGHLGRVSTIAFSPDGFRLASGSLDRSVILWDGVTGTYIATLEGHSSTVITVVFSADGARLASGSDDNTIKLWNGVTGGYITVLEGHSKGVRTIAFSPDGSRIASGSDDKTVKFWDGATGVCIATLEGHPAYLRIVVFSADSSTVTSEDYSGHIKYWDSSTGNTIPPPYDLQPGLFSIQSSIYVPSTLFGSLNALFGITQGGTAALLSRYTIQGTSIISTPGSVPLVWLPSKFRNSTNAIHGNMFAFGLVTGEVILLRLPLLDDI